MVESQHPIADMIMAGFLFTVATCFFIAYLQSPATGLNVAAAGAAACGFIQVGRMIHRHRGSEIQ